MLQVSPTPFLPLTVSILVPCPVTLTHSRPVALASALPALLTAPRACVLGKC